MKDLQEYINEARISLKNEAMIDSENDFREAAKAYLKKAHGDNYDEEKANSAIDDIAKKVKSGEGGIEKDDWVAGFEILQN